MGKSLDRHTIDTQDEIINGLRKENERLREENKQLRGLLRECQDYVEAGMSSVDTELCDRIEKELGDE